MAISVTEPISPAMRRAKWITFQPFDLRKWFVLGFCRFSLHWAKGAATRTSTSTAVAVARGRRRSGCLHRAAPGVPSTAPAGPAQAPGPFDEILAWTTARPARDGGDRGRRGGAGDRTLAAAPVARHSGARSCSSTASPATRRRSSRRGGGSVGTATASSLFTSRCGDHDRCDARRGGGGSAGRVAGHPARTFGSNAGVAVVLGLVLLLPALILSALIQWCTDTFVTVIMYARDTTVVPAWREFRQNVLAGHVGTLFLFLLMESLVVIVVVMIAMLVGCVTLCIGFLPYLSNVIMLPLEVFMRSYPIYFLQQFGPQYVILHEPPPVGYGFPVVMHPPPPPPMG